MNLIDNTVTVPMTFGAEYKIDYSAQKLAPFLKGTLTKLDSTLISETVTSFRDYQFQNFSYLTEVDLDQITSVGISTFFNCAILELNLPNLVNAGMNSFSYNPFIEIELPKLSSIGSGIFRNCQNLQKADFLLATEINGNAFYQCANLDTLILRSNTVVNLVGYSQFYGTKIESGEGYIYVPSNLVENYLETSAWQAYTSQIRSIDEL